MNFTPDELKEIERQLSCPDGEFGIYVAENMNESNISMTLSSLDALDIQNEDVILEIGHGNCGHLNELLKRANGIKYTGLEISETMKSEALRINKELIANEGRDISFLIYDGKDIPLADNSIGKIFTVNTLYFWEKPSEFLTELYRVLKQGGICVITFAQKEFMLTLPFVNDGFQLYDHHDFGELVKQTNFHISASIDKTEPVTSKAGDFVDRTFTVAKMIKE